MKAYIHTGNREVFGTDSVIGIFNSKVFPDILDASAIVMICEKSNEVKLIKSKISARRLKGRVFDIKEDSENGKEE